MTRIPYITQKRKRTLDYDSDNGINLIVDTVVKQQVNVVDGLNFNESQNDDVVINCMNFNVYQDDDIDTILIFNMYPNDGVNTLAFDV